MSVFKTFLMDDKEGNRSRTEVRLAEPPNKSPHACFQCAHVREQSRGEDRADGLPPIPAGLRYLQRPCVRGVSEPPLGGVPSLPADLVVVYSHMGTVHDYEMRSSERRQRLITDSLPAQPLLPVPVFVWAMSRLGLEFSHKSPPA